jgi:hypothetical protein
VYSLNSVNVHVNTFSAASADRETWAPHVYRPVCEAVAEAARLVRRERHASCYYPVRRRRTDVEEPFGRSGRSVPGGGRTVVEKNRDYHRLRGGTSEISGPDTSRHSPGKGCFLGHSPCRIVQAIYPVALSFHLSVRPFWPDRCLDIRPLCGMTADFTENPTLSRAYALRDSPWSVEGPSPAPPGGSDCLSDAYATGCCSVGNATHDVCHRENISQRLFNIIVYNGMQDRSPSGRRPWLENVPGIRKVAFTIRRQSFPKGNLYNRLYMCKIFFTIVKDRLPLSGCCREARIGSIFFPRRRALIPGPIDRKGRNLVQFILKFGRRLRLGLKEQSILRVQCSAFPGIES